MPHRTEHLSDGKFASKEVTGSSVKNGRKRDTRFKTGNPGRPKGALNKTTRAVKEFLAELVDDEEVQTAVRGRIVKGDAVAFFRALEHVLGKPRESSDVNLNANVLFGWVGEKSSGTNGKNGKK